MTSASDLQVEKLWSCVKEEKHERRGTEWPTSRRRDATQSVIQSTMRSFTARPFCRNRPYLFELEGVEMAGEAAEKLKKRMGVHRWGFPRKSVLNGNVSLLGIICAGSNFRRSFTICYGG
jgi:hypothetical protein